MRYECYKNDTRASWVKNFDFDNSKSKNYLLEIPRSHAKMSLKSAPQELFDVKTYIKSYILDCSWTLMHLPIPA